MAKTALRNEIWIMHTADGFYPIQPSVLCKPEDHGTLNPHVLAIEDMSGNVLWSRQAGNGGQND